MSEKKPLSHFHLIEDFRGHRIRLYEHTIKHIRLSHPEIVKPLEFVTQILKDPILLTEDETPGVVIYHRSAGKPLVHLAYVEIQKYFVKSAHISDKIKGGKILWLKETKDLLF